MGSCLAGTFTRSMVESFIDALQEKGLGQLADKGFGLNKWNSQLTFGYDFSRNQSFKTLLESLVKPFKDGMRLAGVSPAEMNMLMETYVNTYLANHVMKCLLKAPDAPMPELQVNGLPTGNFLKEPQLPNYAADEVAAFQARWTTLPQGQKINIATTDDAKKDVLSALLADRVIQTVQAIDVAQVVGAFFKEYLAQQRQEELRKHGLFAAAGPASLAAGRQAYTEEQQQQDLEKQIKEDLHTASPGDVAAFASQARL